MGGWPPYVGMMQQLPFCRGPCVALCAQSRGKLLHCCDVFIIQPPSHPAPQVEAPNWPVGANPLHRAPLTTQTLQDRPTPQSCCERYVEQCRPAFWPAVCTICVSARALCNLHVAFLDIHNVLRPEPLNMAILVHNKYCILCSKKWLSEAHLVLLTLCLCHYKFNHYASSSDCHIMHNEHIIAQMYFGSFIFVQCIDNLPPIIHSWSVYLYISLSSCTIW